MTDNKKKSFDHKAAMFAVFAGGIVGAAFPMLAADHTAVACYGDVPGTPAGDCHSYCGTDTGKTDCGTDNDSCLGAGGNCCWS